MCRLSRGLSGHGGAIAPNNIGVDRLSGCIHACPLPCRMPDHQGLTAPGLVQPWALQLWGPCGAHVEAVQPVGHALPWFAARGCNARGMAMHLAWPVCNLILFVAWIIARCHFQLNPNNIVHSFSSRLRRNSCRTLVHTFEGCRCGACVTFRWGCHLSLPDRAWGLHCFYRPVCTCIVDPRFHTCMMKRSTRACLYQLTPTFTASVDEFGRPGRERQVG